jgi:hypothetical protein
MGLAGIAITLRLTDQTRREQLLQQFKELSVRHYEASAQGDFETVNKVVAAIKEIVRELWDSGGRTKEALKALSELSKDRNPRVAIKAVIYTVELYPQVADELGRLQRDKGLVGLAAKNAIKNVQRGNVGWLREVLNG